MGEWTEWKDEQFFEAIRDQPVLGTTLARLGFEAPEVKRWQRNAVLLISRPAWITPLRTGNDLQVRVHYEARRRGEFRVEAEVHPYEGSIDQHPEREAALQPVLELKAAVLADLTPVIDQVVREFVRSPD